MSNIKIIKTDSLAKITLAKPPLNIMDIEDLNELAGLLARLGKEKNLKAITIDSDQKLFSAGVNIALHDIAFLKEALMAFHSVFFAVLELDIPVISLVQGGCIGGGCELALFSDMVIASEKAYFSQPEIKLGCFPPISMAYFPYITSNKKAIEMILCGEKISAKDALNFGLINQVCSEESFKGEIEKFINSITGNSSSVIRTTLKGYKKMHYAEIRAKIEQAEKIYLEELIQLEDAQEGLKAFLEKRQPKWTGK